MRYLILLIWILLISFDLKSQIINVNVRFLEKGNRQVYTELTIDNLVYIDHDFNYNVKLKKGLHRFIGKSSDRQILIDTAIFIKDTTSIILPIDIINDGLLWDFKIGFQKVYYDYHNSIVIGLKNDNTFTRKSFFHISLAGCNQYETGQYRIINDTLLILHVVNYKCPCAELTNVNHTYRHVIVNDSIKDIDKYVGYIEKKYFGAGYKEFNE